MKYVLQQMSRTLLTLEGGVLIRVSYILIVSDLPTCGITHWMCKILLATQTSTIEAEDLVLEDLTVT